jgi:hypothetical protein
MPWCSSRRRASSGVAGAGRSVVLDVVVVVVVEAPAAVDEVLAAGSRSRGGSGSAPHPWTSTQPTAAATSQPIVCHPPPRPERATSPSIGATIRTARPAVKPERWASRLGARDTFRPHTASLDRGRLDGLASTPLGG